MSTILQDAINGTSCVHLRRASATDRECIEGLLAGAGLPRDGVGEWIEQFWVAEPAGEGDREVVGVAGLELYGDSALIRSVAVAPAWRGAGVGRLLTERVLDDATARGARELFLLTTTAEGYFPRLGFACVARETAPDALQGSAEFRGACPASATLMRRPARTTASLTESAA